jgi:uracil-DNA glycosylase family 4
MLNIPGLYEDEKENVLTVIKDLSVPCHDCRLGYLQNPKHNRGLIWRGDPKARIAAVSIMPGPKEMESGKPLTGGSGKLFDKWFQYLKIDTNKDMLVINVVQCKPPDVLKKGEEKESQRAPEMDEMAVCFPNRCLRVLLAMPNLEVIVTLGWEAARCIVGGTPGDATHMGHWYSTSLLPGKAIYCLPHPAALLREEKNLEKKYKVIKCLDRFKRSYIDTNKVPNLLAVTPTEAGGSGGLSALG